jgi:TRAP-type C4-dicarboxylate transport system permease small subunit
MAHEPIWDRRAPKPRSKTASSISCMVFVTAMGVAIWIGAIWASQAWFDR